jgi:uncharacterized surface protein with fasciclin (FAS1) repeats
MTLFAPNNDAFASLMATPGFPPAISMINPDLIKSVLLYHAASQAFTKNDLKAGTTITTLEGEKITINDDGTLKTGATNPNIEIDKADIKATNGIIQITKSVLIPPSVGATLTPLLGTVAGTLMLGADFSTLANAIKKADSSVPTGLSSLISLFSGSSPITFFAPPNQVFVQSGLNVEDYPASFWRAIILYHAISGTKTVAQLTDRSYASLMGEKIYITKTDLASYVNGFPIAVPDAAPASNGIVHVLAGFLIPGAALGGDVVGVASMQGFDSLVVALDLAGLTSTLKGTNTYTVFAPPNEAFAGLLQHLGLTKLNQIPLTTLQAILSYHIISGYNFSSDFTDGTSYTTLAGIGIKANVNAQGLSFTDGTGTAVPVVYPDLKATNGVLHIIGGVLQPN